MNIQIAKAVALGVAVMAGAGAGALAETSTRGSYEPPPMGEQFTSQKSVAPTDGPSVTKLAYEDRARRNKCSHWVVDSLIQACADKAQRAAMEAERLGEPKRKP